MDQENKCIGILGALFGHKFRDWYGTYSWCQRCGKRGNT